MIYTKDNLAAAIEAAFNRGREYQADRDASILLARRDRAREVDATLRFEGVEDAACEAWHGAIEDVCDDFTDACIKDAFTSTKEADRTCEILLSEQEDVNVDSYHDLFQDLLAALTNIKNDSPLWEKQEAFPRILEALKDNCS